MTKYWYKNEIKSLKEENQELRYKLEEYLKEHYNVKFLKICPYSRLITIAKNFGIAQENYVYGDHGILVFERIKKKSELITAIINEIKAIDEIKEEGDNE